MVNRYVTSLVIKKTKYHWDIFGYYQIDKLKVQKEIIQYMARMKVGQKIRNRNHFGLW